MTFGISAATYAAVAAAATVGSLVVGEKSRKAQRKAARNQEGVRRAQQAREQMKAVREQRIAQAQIVQGAATGGISGSSAAQGGYSSVGSLTAGNMQFSNQMDFFQTRIAQNMTKANQYAGQASMFGAASNLAMMGSSMAPNKTTISTNAINNNQFVQGVVQSDINAGGTGSLFR